LVEFAWLIPLLPALAFVLIIFLGRKLPGDGAPVAIFGMACSLAMTLYIAVTWFLGGASAQYAERFSTSVSWMPGGPYPINVGFAVDALTIVMLLVVTVVALMVQIYSIGYMHGDPRYPRYYAYLSLFSSAMLTLVIANNILLMFMAWELVGLTSYLLIGFWFEKKTAMRAAKKAFLVTRVGDVGFLSGLALLYINTNSLDLFGHQGIFENLKMITGTVHVGPWTIGLVAGIALLLFCGAIGKSAQFPLHVWLPDAMEGPTPVSALIHAATMVAAGVYLVARMYPVFLADTSHVALNVVAYTGAFTALFAATIGLAQNDIKRVLAYSTVSQLGYMIMALGVFGYAAGMFHLMTHAYFKALLFLGSGSVIHGTGTQDLREMGGLRKKMPVTFWTFLIGTLSLCGLPFITAGGWSKEEILTVAYHTNPIVFVVGLLGAFLTSTYMFRLVFMAFFGKPRNPKVHAHESPKVMTIPLMILSVLAIVAGFVGTPFANVFEHHMMPVLGEYKEGLESILSAHGFVPGFNIIVFLCATAVAFGGGILAWAIWHKHIIKIEKLEPSFGWLAKIVENKYYIDEFYNATIVWALMMLAKAMFWFDRWVIDYCIVNGVGYLALMASRVWGLFDRYVIDGVVNLVGWITKTVGNLTRYFQTGMTQQYIFMTACAMLLLSLAALALHYSEATWIPFQISGFFR